ncbi:hypothetical protein RUM44_000095 [Polyplax serrata]|uniref:Uncharacterized protein n=1 Tax=Polyplax serrata TaxID=468196 RepID=A0ABR1B4G7_POLSC
MSEAETSFRREISREKLEKDKEVGGEEAGSTETAVAATTQEEDDEEEVIEKAAVSEEEATYWQAKHGRAKGKKSRRGPPRERTRLEDMFEWQPS